MDKKNLTIGIAFIVAAFATLFIGQRYSPPPAQASSQNATATPAATGPQATLSTPANAPAPAGILPAAPAAPTLFAALTDERADAVTTILANDFIEARLTDFGGAISSVAFKKYDDQQASNEPFVFNRQHAAPMLAIGELQGLDQNTRFARVSATSTEVVYQTVFENRLEVTRRYRLPTAGEDPYRIRHETTFRNLTDQTFAMPRLALELGTTSLISANDLGQYLNVATNNGEDTEYIERSALEGGGFLAMLGLKDGAPKAVIEQPLALTWAAVKNQFFASIYTPDTPGTGVSVRRVDLPPLAGSTRANTGITAAARFELPALAPGASATQSGLLYVGPKEYTRLAKFEHSEDKVMQFDRYFFNRIFLSGYVAPFLNHLMNWTHGIVGSWGLAIVLMTILLKFISVPFTLAASRSAKKMAKLAEPMKAIREKYKDNPKKLNEATLALFKEHKVNPAGGCIPILITIPLFVGFFAMLQGTAELRFQGFLWAHDLSAPDTIWHVPGIGLPLNIMPLLMGATMIYQMRLTPTPTSMEGPQAMIMKLMPIVFTFICYNFAAALALYSTINGLFTIVQQLLVNKYSKDEPLAVTPVASGKKVKNVTPKK
jgi:YidC/Oxa1 family membrane protein insertase